MKTLFVITPHSILDVITNSSTELFVCDTDKTVEMVKLILAANHEMHGYSEPWVFNIEEYRTWKKERRAAQIRSDEYYAIHGESNGELDQYWDHKFGNIDGWFYDIEDEEDLRELREKFIENGDNSGGWWSEDRNPFAKRLREVSEKAAKVSKDPDSWRERYKAREAEVQKIYEEIEVLENKPDWWINPLKYYYNSQPTGDLDGKIMIVGDSDNSIPYEQFDWIEETFNAVRHHLG